MVIAADYPFLNIVGSTIVFFGWVMWLWLMITVFSDLFGRTDLSGWSKAGWTLFCLVLPFIGVLIYLGTQGKEMAERRMQEVEAAKAASDAYIRDVAATGGTAEIAKAKELLDSGAINQKEYDQIKQKVLA